MNEKIIFSEKILSYNREYLFDVKENNNGTPYLRITQIINSSSGKTNQTIFIFNEDSKRFIETIHMAFKKFPPKQYHHSIHLEGLRKPKKKAHKKGTENDDRALVQYYKANESMKVLHKSYINARKTWTDNDDQTLEQLYKAKESIEEMCNILGSAPGEIEIRITILELEDKYGI